MMITYTHSSEGYIGNCLDDREPCLAVIVVRTGELPSSPTPNTVSIHPRSLDDHKGR